MNPIEPHGHTDFAELRRLQETLAQRVRLESLQLQPESAAGVDAAECRSCGFVFTKRDRLATPGKCPICRCESISEPFFTIRKERDS